jgi:hypothetical protein
MSADPAPDGPTPGVNPLWFWVVVLMFMFMGAFIVMALIQTHAQ